VAATPGGVGTIDRAVHLIGLFIKSSAIVCRLTLLAERRIMLPSSLPAVGAEKGFLQYSFAGGVDGAYPESDLIMDAAENLYGTTNQGGAVGGGTVFELTRTHDGWKHQVLHSFADGTNDGGGRLGF
jgi:uncharacterized repeat protein (TIGR03803 family)